jgi:hypothetical protein
VRSSMLESLTLTSAPSSTTPAPGATEVVEAATAEAAIAAVHASLGADARIIDARRVLRGGIGGFFAKEIVQLHAAPGAASPVVTRPIPPSVTGASDTTATSGIAASSADRGAVSLAGPWGAVLRSEAGRTAEPEAAGLDVSPVDRLLDSASEVSDAVDFATFLRRRLADEDATTSPDEAVSCEPTMPSTVFGAVEPAAWSPEPADPDAVFVRGLPVPPAAATEPMTVSGPTTPGLSGPTTPGLSGPTTPGPLSVPSVCEPSPSSDGGPPWSVGVLLQLGLPIELVRSLEVSTPADDLAWTTALAEALRPSCRPLPAGPAVMLGPHAHLIGEVEGTPAARSETWLKALRGGRWLHLVVGGEGWRAPLAEQPLAASWARPEDLPDALRCAVELGLVLGFGPLGGRIRRARPLDVALAIRDLVDIS